MENLHVESWLVIRGNSQPLWSFVHVASKELESTGTSTRPGYTPHGKQDAKTRVAPARIGRRKVTRHSADTSTAHCHHPSFVAGAPPIIAVWQRVPRAATAAGGPAASLEIHGRILSGCRCAHDCERRSATGTSRLSLVPSYARVPGLC